MWIDKNGYTYAGDRQGNDSPAPPRPTNTVWERSTQSWQPLINQETDLDVIQQAAKFLLENLSVTQDKQTELNQLKTKLNAKRRI